MEKLKLFSDHVLVKRTIEKISKGGLHLLGPGDVASVESVVVAVGDGKFSPKAIRIPMTVKPGDRVMHGAGAGVKMDFNGEECLMMHEADLLCILE